MRLTLEGEEGEVSPKPKVLKRRRPEGVAAAEADSVAVGAGPGPRGEGKKFNEFTTTQSSSRSGPAYRPTTSP